MLNVAKLISRARSKIKQAQDLKTLESVRVRYLGRKGYIRSELLPLLRLRTEERRSMGVLINRTRDLLDRMISSRRERIKRDELDRKLLAEKLDISLPGRGVPGGGLHPVSQTIDWVENFFARSGFDIVTGPEIEDDYHNFEMLNIDKHHPARTGSDTFWIDEHRLLRTQTSSIQVREMKQRRPPIRIVSSGKVYRNDCDRMHTPVFHQTEGVLVDRRTNFSELKGVVRDLLLSFFGKTIQIRFRPSYFPFTEPSAEVDVLRGNSWVEVLGCGMIHPQVMRNAGIDPNVYSGSAFGMGIERLVMLRHEIDDLRTLFENDVRFLRQFRQIG